MRSALAVVVLSASAALQWCSRAPVVVGPDPVQTATASAPTPPVDAGLVVLDRCGAYCSRARFLGCKGGLPSPAGTPCEEVCRAFEDAGVLLAKQLPCALDALSCGALEACPN